ncbi:head-tail adaptor protein [Rhizobium sp. SGZ-381]|uniref:phage head completion protein n=1 Tax=Rhizobium sp. SGZ-381 TaxID=3342800 RepID=UPI00367089D2
MARKLGAGNLRHSVAFDARQIVSDGLGNEEAQFVEQFRVRAAFRSKGGSEAVIAARLEGRNLLGVYVRSSPQTRQIKSNWRMRDVETGEIYAVKIVDAVTDRAWVYLEAQTGVAP